VYGTHRTEKYRRRVRKFLPRYGGEKDLSGEEGGVLGEERAQSGAANSPMFLLTPRRLPEENEEVAHVPATSLLRSRGRLRG